MITPDEEYEVALKAQAGDEAAIQKLVESNLRFVMSVAKMYTREAVVMEDLIQVGNIGLIDAARRFDPSKGFKFISFAVWHIRKEMINYLAMNSRTVRLPQNKGQLVAKLREGQNHLYSTLGREPTDEELIEWVKKKTELARTLDKDTLHIIIATDLKAASLDYQLSPDGDATLLDTMPSDDKSAYDHAVESHRKEVLELLMKDLNPLERYVVEEHFGMTGLKFERPFSSIGDELETTAEAARMRLKKALKKMKLAARRYGITFRETISE